MALGLCPWFQQCNLWFSGYIRSYCTRLVSSPTCG